MKQQLLILCMLIVLLACTVEPKPIDFGTDPCDECKMTIVDQRFAAEAVTNKGKVYKFDAIECLIAFLKDKKEEDFKFLLVSDFLAKKLIPAQSAYYVISASISSPMGGGMLAYQNQQDALNFQKDYMAEVFTWAEFRNFMLNK